MKTEITYSFFILKYLVSFTPRLYRLRLYVNPLDRYLVCKNIPVLVHIWKQDCTISLTELT